LGEGDWAIFEKKEIPSQQKLPKKIVQGELWWKK